MTGNGFTKAFKTRSEITERKLPRVNGNNQYKGRTVIALDGGYSSVKGASPNKVFMFPSYAKRAPKDLEVVGKVSPSDIQFRDNKTGEIWLVGQAAENTMDQADLDSTTDTSLYTRYRYDSDVFHVIMASGLAIGLWGTGAGNEIFLQTGLPAKYKENDTPRLIKALVGEYDIAVKIGASDWADFRFTLDEKHIFVMEQPQGTMCAAAYKMQKGPEGESGETEIIGVMDDLGKDILKSNTIILDVGFGTEDLFSIRAGYKNNHQTYSDTGMRAVFEGVIKRMTEKYPEASFKIFEFQKYLEKGKASYFDYDAFGTVDIDFAEILKEVNAELCEKSIRRMMQDYSNLTDYKYLIVTGGGGESRFEQIRERLSGLGGLTILPGNLNTPDLPFAYSNVIGYYMRRLAKLQSKNA